MPIRDEWERWQSGETWGARLDRLGRDAGTHGGVAGPVVMVALAVGILAAAARGDWDPARGALEVVGVVAALGAAIRTVWWVREGRPAGLDWLARPMRDRPDR